MRWCLITVSVLVSIAGAQAQLIEGKLARDLAKPQDPHWRSETMEPVVAERRSLIPLSLTGADRVWMKDIRWQGQASKRKAAIVERTGGKYFFLLDTNGNGRLEPSEIHEMAPGGDGEYDYNWHFPLTSGPFATLPITFRVTPAQSTDGGTQLLQIDDSVVVPGSVFFEGRAVKVFFSYDPSIGEIDPKTATIGVDVDGDGKIDTSAFSPEVATARTESVVYRVGGTYISFERVDVPQLRFYIRTRPPSDYRRIELVADWVVPDFTFTDFQGQPRRLAEFRGKYTVLSFWGAWCVPCLSELPKLRELRTKFQPRGLEILGMDYDQNLQPAAKALEQSGGTWPNAQTSSVKDVVEKQFRIRSWPTLLLIDPRGKILTATSRVEDVDAELVKQFGK